MLKTIGSQILKWVGVVLGVVPLVSPAFNGTRTGAALGGLTQIGNVIITTEQMFTAAFGADVQKGSDKLRAAVPFIGTLIKQSDLLAGKRIKDEAKFEAAVTQITSAFADLLNSVGD